MLKKNQNERASFEMEKRENEKATINGYERENQKTKKYFSWVKWALGMVAIS